MKITKAPLIIIVLLFCGIIDANCQTNNAFGDNQAQVEPGVFAIYSGDVNQDGYISGDDVNAIDADNIAGLFGGYFVTDLNGDAYVAGDDVVLADINNVNGVFIQTP